MSVAFETAIKWVPWAVGVGNSCLMAYYANNFDLTDEDLTHGTLSGTSGDAILAMGAATLAVEVWAVLDWIMKALKEYEGKRTVHNRNAHYGRAMKVFEYMMMVFFIVAITSAAMNVALCVDFENLAVTVNGSKLQGSYGTATAALSYTTIAVGGLAFFVFLYGEIFARDTTEKHPIVVEAYGGH